jgi:hypothetical protein
MEGKEYWRQEQLAVTLSRIEKVAVKSEEVNQLGGKKHQVIALGD